MIGILTEKPSAGRNFVKALGGERGTFNGESYVIVSARGHLYEFVDASKMVSGDELQAKYKDWNVNNLPWNHTELNWKRTPKKDTEMLLKSIKTTLSGCSEIAIATDVDPTGEGDLLAGEILEELKLDNKPLTRFYFIDESEKEIRKAFINRKSISNLQAYPDYRKALYRSKFDFLTMQFTRIALSASDGQSVLRQGRLKSAMVAITGDGLKAVADYKKIPFYQNRFKDENGNIYTNPHEQQFSDKLQVPQIYNPSAVHRDAVERKSTPPKKLLDLASLAALLAPKGFKSSEVLSTYQRMYEAQIVSYPRTEDKTISPEQFDELLPLAPAIAGVVGVDTNLLTHKTPRKTHVKTGGAHGANRPGLKVPADLDSLSSYGSSAAQIYTLLAKSYLAMLAEDYEYDCERGCLVEYPDFKAVVNIPVKLGWKHIFGQEIDDDNDDSNTSRIGTYAEPFTFEGFPTRPPAPTMKWLMAQLAKRDVGTGATRTSTYADVTNEKAKCPLLADTMGKLSMTEFGMMSYKLLPGTKIGSVELTEELQQDMRDIASGTANPELLLSKIAEYVAHDLSVMFENGNDIPKVKIVPKAKFTGVWVKNNQQISFTREWCGYMFSDEECASLLGGEIINISGAVSPKTGETFDCKGQLEEGVYKGKPFVGFKADYTNPDDPAKFTGVWVKTNKEVSFKREWCKYAFSDDECRRLLGGETIEVKGAISSKTGKPFDCKGFLAEDTYKGKKYVGFKMEEADEPPKSWCGHIFTSTETADLLAGKPVFAQDFVSTKTGKYFTAELKWNKKTKKLDISFGK